MINTKLSVFIQPSLVKKSYLYLGIPPRTTTRSPINIINFIPMNMDKYEVSFIVDSICINGFSKLEVKLVININKIINVVVNEYCTVLIKFWDTNKGFIYHEKIKKKSVEYI
jgi:hypothetical protein